MQRTTQSELPIDFAPSSLLKRGLAGAHARPLVGYGKVDGVWVREAGDSRTTPRKAWRYPELEWTQTSNRIVAVALDVDDMDAFLEARLAFDETGVGAPEPSVIIMRRANGHAHVVYLLADPVFVGASGGWRRALTARVAPSGVAGVNGNAVKQLCRVEAWLVETTGADPSYPAMMAHNPMRTRHAPKREWLTEWGRRKAYTLGELSKAIAKGWKVPRRPRGGVNRLCSLLRDLGSWYGKPANWWVEFDALLDRAVALDAEYAASTGYAVGAEGLRPTVQSVYDSQRANLAKGIQQAAFSAMQSARGRKSRRNIDAEQASLLRMARGAGETLTAAAQQAGVSVRTAKAKVGGRRWQAEGRIRKRRGRVAQLREDGLSLRQIAAKVGCAYKTVHRDLAAIEARRKAQREQVAAFVAKHRSSSA